MLSKPLTSYEFTECIVKIGDVFYRDDFAKKTYVVTGITELSWMVGKKKTKKREHSLEVFMFETGKSLNVNAESFRKYYLNNTFCKKIWSLDVPDKRDDLIC